LSDIDQPRSERHHPTKMNALRSIFLVGRRGEFPTLSKDIAHTVRQSLQVLLESHSWLRPYVPASGTDPGG
jgi:hypothetical protein